MSTQTLRIVFCAAAATTDAAAASTASQTWKYINQHELCSWSPVGQMIIRDKRDKMGDMGQVGQMAKILLMFC